MCRLKNSKSHYHLCNIKKENLHWLYLWKEFQVHILSSR